MSRRTALPQHAATHLSKLVEALRRGQAPENMALIAERAKRVLQWAPSGCDRGEWLRSLLPEPWHFQVAAKALAEAATPAANGSTPDAARAAVQQAPARSGRRAGRRGRQH